MEIVQKQKQMIQDLFQHGKSVKEIYAELQHEYKDKALQPKSISYWFSELKKGRICLKNRKKGYVEQQTDEEICIKARKLIKKNRRLPIKDLAVLLNISTKRTSVILKSKMKMVKVHAQWMERDEVPHSVNNNEPRKFAAKISHLNPVDLPRFDHPYHISSYEDEIPYKRFKLGTSTHEENRNITNGHSLESSSIYSEESSQNSFSTGSSLEEYYPYSPDSVYSDGSSTISAYSVISPRSAPSPQPMYLTDPKESIYQENYCVNYMDDECNYNDIDMKLSALEILKSDLYECSKYKSDFDFLENDYDGIANFFLNEVELLHIALIDLGNISLPFD